MFIFSEFTSKLAIVSLIKYNFKMNTRMLAIILITGTQFLLQGMGGVDFACYDFKLFNSL